LILDYTKKNDRIYSIILSLSQEFTMSNINLSSRTIEILKNYASINSNILIKKGNTLTTISPVKNILASAHVSEVFPEEFGIWDLGKFLSTLALYTDPTLDFQKSHVVISSATQKNKKSKFYYSAPSLLTVPTKEIKMPSVVVSFALEDSVIKEILKASSVLSLPDIRFRSDGDSIIVECLDKANKTSNTHSISIPYTSEGEFEFYFKSENWKLLPGSYNLDFAASAVCKFTSTGPDFLEYFIAMESDSSFKSN